MGCTKKNGLMTVLLGSKPMELLLHGFGKVIQWLKDETDWEMIIEKNERGGGRGRESE